MRSFLVLFGLIVAAALLLVVMPAQSRSPGPGMQASSSSEEHRVAYLSADHACPPELLEELNRELELDPAAEEEFETRMIEVLMRAFEEGREPSDAEIEAVLKPLMDMAAAKTVEVLRDCLREPPAGSLT